MNYKTIFFCATLMITFTGFANAGSLTVTTDSLPVLNRKAPDFLLKDMLGKTVSLSSFKGKVVILDFWATWCIPCQESFPGLQRAVNHYARQDNVVFLFIDTRERSADYEALAKALIVKGHYTFKVLFDEKGADGVQNKQYKIYDMPGLPTKFIIDAEGIIRYQLEGYAKWRSDDEHAAEIIKLVEKTKRMTR